MMNFTPKTMNVRCNLTYTDGMEAENRSRGVSDRDLRMYFQLI